MSLTQPLGRRNRRRESPIDPEKIEPPPWALSGELAPQECVECGATFMTAFRARKNCDACVQKYKTLGPLHYQPESRDAQLDTRLAEANIYGKLKSDFHLERFRPADNPRALGIAQNFVAQYPGYPSVAFTGNAGTGKSHLAYGVARKLVERRVEVKCVYLPMLIWNLQISDPWRKVAIADVHPLLRAEVVVIDDIGREPKTDTLAGFFDNLFNERWVRERPTIITSNLSVDKLEQWFGMASASRFLEAAYVEEFKGPDRRLVPFDDAESSAASDDL
jgi:DNA replication protein DnaC